MTQPLQFSYQTSVTPSPLTEDCSNATVTFTVTNNNGGGLTAKINTVNISIPWGATSGDLVPDFGAVTIAYASSNVQATLLAPRNELQISGFALAYNASFTVTLNLSSVADATGQVTLSVQECNGNTVLSQGSITSITICQSGLSVTGPYAEPPDLLGSGSTTISWNITGAQSGDTVSLDYVLGNMPYSYATSPVTVPDVDATTVFTLSLQDANQNMLYQSQVMVSVSQPPPAIGSFTGSVAWSTVENCPQLTLTWSTTNATACTISGDGTRYEANGNAIYNLAPNDTAPQSYTLTATGSAGNTATSTIVLDWSDSAITSLPIASGTVLPGLFCSPISGNVYGCIAGNATQLFALQLEEEAIIGTLDLAANCTGCSIVAILPTKTLSATDIVFLAGPACGLLQAAITVSGGSPTAILTPVTGWPAAVTVAATDGACLLGSPPQTLAIACASAPGQVQLVDLGSMSYSGSIDMSGVLESIGALLPLDPLGGLLALSNNPNGTQLASCIPATGAGTVTAQNFPHVPLGGFVSTGGDTAYVYALTSLITGFDAAQPSLTQDPVTVDIANPANSQWAVVPTPDGSGFLLLCGPNQNLILSLESLLFTDPSETQISDSPSTIFGCEIVWTGGACVTPAWPTLVVTTSEGLAVFQSSLYR